MEEMKMKKMLVLVTVMALSLVSMAQAADLQGDFSLDQNPNGDWTYGSIDVTAGTFTTYNGVNSGMSGASTFSAWVTDSNWDSYGNVGKNFGPDPIEDWSSYREVGQIIYGPAVWTNGSGVYYLTTSRWTAPAAGSYDIDATFTGQWPSGSSVTASVRLNGTEIFSGAIDGFIGKAAEGFSDRWGDHPSQNYIGTLSLNANNTLDFCVQVLGNAASTGVDIQITPEPITMALMGLGGLALIRRRRA